MLIAVNGFSVLVGAIIAMVVGSLWYSPWLFGTQWMLLRGQDLAGTKSMKFPVREMLVQFVASLITAFLIAEFCQWLGITDVLSGILLGFWLWLGFYATTMLDDVLWNKGPWKLYLINTSQRLVTLLIMSGVIGVWH